MYFKKKKEIKKIILNNKSHLRLKVKIILIFSTLYKTENKNTKKKIHPRWLYLFCLCNLHNTPLEDHQRYSCF